MLVCFTASAQHTKVVTDISFPEHTLQLIVVITPSPSSVSGKLQRYERNEGGWQPVGAIIDVMVGKNGMAWGRGLHVNTNGLEKSEGDGRAPAGIFSLGTMFGYNANSPNAYSYPYRQSTEKDFFIDDVQSDEYNQWVHVVVNKPEENWKSFEKMKRKDHLYEHGIVVEHNMSPVIKGKGSAIFIHVWRDRGVGTLGCTSMSKQNMLELLKWLDPQKKPLLVQVPESELGKLAYAK